MGAAIGAHDAIRPTYKVGPQLGTGAVRPANQMGSSTVMTSVRVMSATGRTPIFGST
jgi:hypothetical protein